ncbi:MAG: carboxypeptidase-like regulatory domain-containing protein, partial [Saprospiraceae bacterium]
MKFMRFTLTGFMLLVTMAITAQTMVKGVVTSADDGEPLIGVTVLVKGTSSGTATDLDGKFELMANTSKDVLSFSYTGFTSKDVVLNGQTMLEVS